MSRASEDRPLKQKNKSMPIKPSPRLTAGSVYNRAHVMCSRTETMSENGEMGNKAEMDFIKLLVT